MTKTEYEKLAQRFGDKSIHFTVKDGSMKVNKKVEAK